MTSTSQKVEPTVEEGIRLPAQLPYSIIFGFATLLLLLQLISGTDAQFALSIFAFVIVFGVMFNVSRGLKTTTGVSVTMMAAKIVLFSQVVKLFFWQPADSYLEVPRTTALVLVFGLVSMLVGIRAAGQTVRHQGWLKPITERRALGVGAIACLAIGGAAAAIILSQGIDVASEERVTGGALRYAYLLVAALPLSIVFATAYTITRTQGLRTFSWFVALCLLSTLGFAAVQGTKQGVFETILYYALTCVAWKFRFRRRHVLTLAFLAVVGVAVVWPVIQMMKSITLLTSASIGERVDMMKEAISEISSYKEFSEARDDIDELFSHERFEYYGRPSGWLERFSLIEPDDELVLATLQQGETGWMTIVHGFRALVPSFIDPDKPTRGTGNFLGHRIDYLGPDDEDTQLAFGVIAESFSSFSWLGVCVIPAILMWAFVQIFSRLSSGIEYNVWTVYLFGRLQHTFVEQTISGLIREMVMLPLVMLVLAVLVRMAGQLTARRG